MQILKEALGFNMSGVAGCIVSHRHRDHAKYGIDYMKAGINVYCADPPDSWIGKHRYYTLSEEESVWINPFRVLPFRVEHDVPTMGFYIRNSESGNILFATDTAYVRNRFNNMSHIMIEANYSEETLLNDHPIGRHMALESVSGFLRANDTTQVRTVVLMHLSASNSDAKKFQETIKGIVPHAQVVIADKGVNVSLNKYPF
jgi:phosphoribosyl 1,2-cyclic phosphodiesterase